MLRFVMKTVQFVSHSYLKAAERMRFVSQLVQRIATVRPEPTVAQPVFVSRLRSPLVQEQPTAMLARLRLLEWLRVVSVSQIQPLTN